jgi:hypothetical protein
MNYLNASHCRIRLSLSEILGLFLVDDGPIDLAFCTIFLLEPFVSTVKMIASEESFRS